MGNNITELVFLLDRSGSMSGLESDTIGGFNTMLEKQKAQPGRVFVTTVLFDHELQTVHDRLPLEKVPAMTAADYSVRGCTALVDAIGRTIRHIVSIHRYARPEDVPERTVFVITTDGLENASKHYTARDVRAMVEHEKKNYGWEFLFLGANIDAVTTAGHLGIGADRATDYRADSQGTGVVYETVSAAVSQLRRQAPLTADWAKSVREDYNNRP